jgi:hypothetical protein
VSETLPEYPNVQSAAPVTEVMRFDEVTVQPGFQPDAAVPHFIVTSASEAAPTYAVNPDHERAAELARMVVQGWHDYQRLDEAALRSPKVQGELSFETHDDGGHTLVASDPAVLDAALQEMRWQHVGRTTYSSLELAVNARTDLRRLTAYLGHEALLEIGNE